MSTSLYETFLFLEVIYHVFLLSLITVKQEIFSLSKLDVYIKLFKHILNKHRVLFLCLFQHLNKTVPLRF